MKTAVIGFLERGGKVIARPIPDATKTIIKPLLLKTIAKGSIVCTDEYNVYDFLPRNYIHQVVKHHDNEYVNGNAYTNTVEGFWGLMKRGIIGIYHHTSRKHLSAYCDEYAYRYNTRRQSDRDRFLETLGKSCNFKLPYKRLIERDPWRRN